jgi:hypothetical protein
VESEKIIILDEYRRLSCGSEHNVSLASVWRKMAAEGRKILRRRRFDTPTEERFRGRIAILEDAAAGDPRCMELAKEIWRP